MLSKTGVKKTCAKFIQDIDTDQITDVCRTIHIAVARARGCQRCGDDINKSRSEFCRDVVRPSITTHTNRLRVCGTQASDESNGLLTEPNFTNFGSMIFPLELGVFDLPTLWHGAPGVTVTVLQLYTRILRLTRDDHDAGYLYTPAGGPGNQKSGC
jgi:hypothetical protein